MCSCDQSLVTLAFPWEKLSEPQLYKDLIRNTTLFEGEGSGFEGSSLIIWDWHKVQT